MYTTDQIINTLKENKSRLIGKYPISEMGIIGLGFIKLAHDLEDIFNKKIDLVALYQRNDL